MVRFLDAGTEKYATPLSPIKFEYFQISVEILASIIPRSDYLIQQYYTVLIQYWNKLTPTQKSNLEQPTKDSIVSYFVNHFPIINLIPTPSGGSFSWGQVNKAAASSTWNMVLFDETVAGSLDETMRVGTMFRQHCPLSKECQTLLVYVSLIHEFTHSLIKSLLPETVTRPGVGPNSQSYYQETVREAGDLMEVLTFGGTVYVEWKKEDRGQLRKVTKLFFREHTTDYTAQKDKNVTVIYQNYARAVIPLIKAEAPFVKFTTNGLVAAPSCSALCHSCSALCYREQLNSIPDTCPPTTSPTSRILSSTSTDTSSSSASRELSLHGLGLEQDLVIDAITGNTDLERDPNTSFRY